MSKRTPEQAEERFDRIKTYANTEQSRKQYGQLLKVRRNACYAAFHSPTRTIATENIPEGLVWKLIDALQRAHWDILRSGVSLSRVDQINEEEALLSSLKIEEDHDRL